MKRKVFNRYKITRKFRQAKGHWSHIFGARMRARLGDTVVAMGTVKNPYHVGTKKVSWKIRLHLIFLFAVTFGIVGLIFFHPFFQIQAINIQGYNRLEESEIESVVQGAINDRLLGFIPKNSYVLVSVFDIREILMKRFPLEQVIVAKSFPHTLDVQVVEKISTIIYDSGGEYSLVGTDGYTIEMLRKVDSDEWKDAPPTTAASSSLATSTAPVKIHTPDVKGIQSAFGTYPVVYVPGGKTAGVNVAVLPQTIVAGIIAWATFLERQLNLSYSYFGIPDNSGFAIIYLKNGAELKVDCTRGQEGQFERLKAALPGIQQSKSGWQYIDLRYPDHVYWR